MLIRTNNYKILQYIEMYIHVSKSAFALERTTKRGYARRKAFVTQARCSKGHVGRSEEYVGRKTYKKFAPPPVRLSNCRYDAFPRCLIIIQCAANAFIQHESINSDKRSSRITCKM